MKRYEIETRGEFLLVRFNAAPSHGVRDALKSKGFRYYHAAKEWVGKAKHRDYVLETIATWATRCEQREREDSPKKETLCWKCAHSGHGNKSPCPWEREFKPVGGWKAVRYELKVCRKSVESYMVLDCPMFRREIRHA